MLWFLKPVFFKQSQRNTSDASRISETLRVAGDGYIGYWFITSPEMRRSVAAQGIQIDFTDDGGLYEERLQKFADGEYDAIFLPVKEYIEHGDRHQYPGVMIASIAESKGADGIVACTDKVPAGSNISILNNPNLRFVYTPQSPSSFLLDLTIVDFDLFRLRDTTNTSWRVEVNGSREVYERAKRKDGDVFILWEPELSKALELPCMEYVWGSDKFAGYIIDVFVFRRDYIEKKGGVALSFLRTYFRVLDTYANNRERMVEEMQKSTRLKQDVFERMLKRIDWFDLQENLNLQFGINTGVGSNAQEGVINTIIASTEVMLRTGRFSKDPLDGNYYLITNRSILEELAKTLTVVPVGNTGATPVDFAAFDETAWKRLKEIGVMRVEPITFQSWNNMLDDVGKEQVDKIALTLTTNYPSYRIAVRGHTGPGANEEENIKLSLQRAEAVAQYLIAVHGVDPDRLKAEGVGSRQPPETRPGESPRAYRYRLSRVEFVLFEANPL